MERGKEANEEMNMDSLYCAWSEDRRGSAPKPLREWTQAHPRQAEALTAWACDAPLLDAAERAPEDAAGTARVREIGRQVVAEMRAQYFAQTAAAPVSLTAAAQKQGLTLADFARKIGVGLTIASKLNRRLIHAEQIPAECLRRMADALDLTAAQVRAYVQQGPTLAQNAMYKSAAAPQVTEKQDFAAAISSASDMTEAEKAFWLHQDVSA